MQTKTGYTQEVVYSYCSPKMLWLKMFRASVCRTFSCGFKLWGFPVPYQDELAAPLHPERMEWDDILSWGYFDTGHSVIGRSLLKVTYRLIRFIVFLGCKAIPGLLVFNEQNTLSVCGKCIILSTHCRSSFLRELRPTTQFFWPLMSRLFTLCVHVWFSFFHRIH